MSTAVEAEPMALGSIKWGRLRILMKMANSKLLPFPAVISGICFDASPKTAFIKA
jgi:hypothetical protein